MAGMEAAQAERKDGAWLGERCGRQARAVSRTTSLEMGLALPRSQTIRPHPEVVAFCGMSRTRISNERLGSLSEWIVIQVARQIRYARRRTDTRGRAGASATMLVPSSSATSGELLRRNSASREDDMKQEEGAGALACLGRTGREGR
jgi:hypothetical protein